MRRLLILVSILTGALLIGGCKEAKSEPLFDNTETNVHIDDIGNVAFSMKTLNGLFFENADGEVLLLSGTETTEGAESEVFVYDITNQKLINSIVVEEACSFTGFCKANNGMLYFGTISGSVEKGSSLYSYDYKENEFAKLHHFQQTGIYALTYADSVVYLATSNDIAVYEYNTDNNNCRLIADGFTDQLFAFSIAVQDEYCYVGIGTVPALEKIDIVSGSTVNLLSPSYNDDSSVMGLTVVNDSLLFLLSPSYTVLKMDLQTDYIEKTELQYRRSTISEIELSGLKHVYDFYGDYLCEYEDKLEILSKRDRNCYYRVNDKEEQELYGLNTSGFIEIRSNNAVITDIDLCEVLQKSYCIPKNCLIVNDIVYVPERRFQVKKLDKDTVLSHLVMDEPQAACFFDGKVFTANYTECTVYAYPVEELCSTSTQIEMNNPDYLIADIDNQCRPKSLDVSFDGRYLVLGSGPLYGKWGGACSIYDLNEHRLKYTVENIVDKHLIQTVCCSESDSNLVWLGTSPYGENTSPVYLEEESSHLVLWDIEGQKILIDLIPENQMRKIGSIVENGNVVFCLTQAGHIVSYSVQSGDLVAKQDCATLNKLLLSKGRMYGISDTDFYYIDQESLELTCLESGFKFLSDLIEDPVTQKIYVVDSVELKAISVSE